MSEYPSAFDEELKQRVRARDGFICQCPCGCGLTQEQSLAKWGEKLSVHHKNEDKRDNSFSNLVTVCKKCHAQHHSFNNVIV